MSDSEILKLKIQPALDRLANSIPIDVRLEITSTDRKNVIDFPKTKYLNDRELEVIQLTASEIVDEIARGKLTSEECTRAFIRSAGLTTQLVNCCTEILGDQAIARAKELDGYFKEHGRTIGPLHGLPMSIKEHTIMKDKVVHSSYVALLDNIETKNGLLVDVLEQCGVVPFCRTSQPQSVMHLETKNNIYGETLNPYNRLYTPGGSSGGESALLAMHGSPIGVGSDIGGSIRNPAAMCGVYGFKPSCGRIPGGRKGLHAGRESITGTNGPMGHSSADMALWMSSVLSKEPWLRDPTIVPIPWRDVNPSEDLIVAVMWSDGIVEPLPPVKRALQQTVAQLKSQGISVVDWTPKEHDKSWDIISSLYYMNNAEDEKAIFAEGCEPMLPLTEWITTQPGVKNYTYDEANDLLMRRNAYRTEYAVHWLEQEAQIGRKIDILLCPAAPGPAQKLGTTKYWSYTSVWNLLDYPGAVFPVDKVQSVDIKGDYIPAAGSESDIWNAYDPEEAEGLPICLQVVGRRYHEEQLLANLSVIEKALRK